MINFTVIIPHKNSPQLLKRCLATIPERSDLEIIIIDDSSDTSIVNFKEFPGQDRKSVKIIESKEGKGAGYARNIGIEQARGKWILFADADDYFTDELEDCLSHYSESDYEFIIFPLKKEENKEEYVEDRSYYFNDLLKKDLSSVRKAVRMQIPSSKLIRLELLKEGNIRFEEVLYGNDVLFSVKVALETKQIHIANSHSIYTLTDTKKSLTKDMTINALRCRMDVSFRSYNYLKMKNTPEVMWRVNKHFLDWARLINLFEVTRTSLLLLKNGLFFYEDDTQRRNYNKYQLFLHYLHYAICKSKR